MIQSYFASFGCGRADNDGNITFMCNRRKEMEFRLKDASVGLSRNWFMNLGIVGESIALKANSGARYRLLDPQTIF
jgi:hypothetical protein